MDKRRLGRRRFSSGEEDGGGPGLSSPTCEARVALGTVLRQAHSCEGEGEAGAGSRARGARGGGAHNGRLPCAPAPESQPQPQLSSRAPPPGTLSLGPVRPRIFPVGSEPFCHAFLVIPAAFISAPASPHLTPISCPFIADFACLPHSPHTGRGGCTEGKAGLANCC
jgi:hypothetical protein